MPAEREEEGREIDVSVVVPTYNVEVYLEEALESARKNNRIALEILVVDDGSVDGTREIAERVAMRDSRVKVVSKQNGGYGQAVNLGFSRARGRYVAILEPDDYPASHMYDDLFELAARFDFPDVVKSSYWRLVQGEDGTVRRWHNDYYRAIRPKSQPFTLRDEPWLIRYHPSIWSALYRRAFLEARGIRFKEVPGAGWVDNPFMVETLAQASSIVYTDEPYYHYREDLPGSSSVTLSWETQFERWMDMMDVLDRLGVDDPQIRQALYVVGFRYVEKALAAYPDDERVREGAVRIFARMDPTLIASLDSVSPSLRELAFHLREEEPPEIDRLAYTRSLVEAGLHSLSINGVGFTAGYLSKYARALRDRLAISKGSEDAG